MSRMTEGSPERSGRHARIDDSAYRTRATYDDDAGLRQGERSRHVGSAGYGGAANGIPNPPSGGSGETELHKRVISSIVYVGAILACLFLGVIPTAIVTAVMSCLCCIEFFQMMRTAGRMPYMTVGLAGAIAFPLCRLLPSGYIIVVIFLFVLLVGIWYVGTPRANVFDVSVTIFGAVYTGVLMSSIVAIRMADPGFEGAWLTFGVLGSIWANDACAYLVGTKFGKHKMMPLVSPHKSWEGFAGGMVGSLVVWCIVAALHLCGLGWGNVIWATLVVGASGVLGDLFESRIKRGVGVKDSGNLMPGHGGMLDRSDSILFGTLAACALFRVWGVI